MPNLEECRNRRKMLVWCQPCDHLKDSCSKAPDVCWLVVAFLPHNFRRHPVRRPSQRIEQLFRILHSLRSSKISKLNGPIHPDENISPFDIPVDDVLRVKILQPFNDLLRELHGRVIAKRSKVADDLLDVTPVHILHHDVHDEPFPINAKKANAVRMMKLLEQIDLCSKGFEPLQIRWIVGKVLGKLDFLYAKDTTGCFVDSFKDGTRGSFSDELTFCPAANSISAKKIYRRRLHKFVYSVWLSWLAQRTLGDCQRRLSCRLLASTWFH